MDQLINKLMVEMQTAEAQKKRERDNLQAVINQTLTKRQDDQNVMRSAAGLVDILSASPQGGGTNLAAGYPVEKIPQLDNTIPDPSKTPERQAFEDALKVASLQQRESGNDKSNDTRERYYRNRLFKDLGEDLTKNVKLKKQDLDEQMGKLTSMLKSGNLAQFKTAATSYLRNIAENKGQTSDPDVKREMPETLAMQYEEIKQWITSNRDEATVPEKYVKPMIDVINTISANKNNILNNYLNTRKSEYLARPDYIEYAPDVENVFETYKKNIFSEPEKKEEAKTAVAPVVDEAKAKMIADIKAKLGSK